MKKNIVAVLLILSAFLTAGEFNVKKFGAKGDGKTDDTAAIQAAVSSAAKSKRVNSARNNQKNDILLMSNVIKLRKPCHSESAQQT